MMKKESAMRMHADKLVQRLRRKRMGGTNQATCPPPAKSSVPTANPLKQKGKAEAAGHQVNPIRFHEVTSRGEVDFHDDQAGKKCAVDSALFFDAYNKWRPQMSEDLVLVGNDGAKGHASVVFTPYVDDRGKMQVSMIVSEAQMGQTILNLDRMVHFS